MNHLAIDTALGCSPPHAAPSATDYLPFWVDRVMTLMARVSDSDFIGVLKSAERLRTSMQGGLPVQRELFSWKETPTASSCLAEQTLVAMAKDPVRQPLCERLAVALLLHSVIALNERSRLVSAQTGWAAIVDRVIAIWLKGGIDNFGGLFIPEDSALCAAVFGLRPVHLRKM